ncbi:MAG: acyl-CoA synthetase FdrA [Anaerolineae bacterium]|nr:acyl-CoA synthetase FdrA [Anaerolineae bacterium]
MAVTRCEIRRGAYFDSIVLMQLQRSLASLAGVVDAGVVMGTPANLDLLAASGLTPDDLGQIGPDDLVIVVRAETEAAARDALGQVNPLLTRRRATTDETYRPRSLATAVKSLPDAQWVLISVPGRYAADVARQALALGRHVFLYSDNVALEDEVALKQAARTAGRLVMGPDCGTAIVNGVGLGFANRVRRGAIGLVGASGTGLQAVTAHIHTLGSGVSHALGTGGRDLKSEVGAVTAHQALNLLARDPDTQVIVLVSKPPAPDVASRLLQAAQAAGKPVVVHFLGYPPPARRLGNLHFALNLSDAAALAVERLMTDDSRLIFPTDNHQSSVINHYVRGLFSGGTLAYEALLGLQTTLYPLYSNAPIRPDQRLPDVWHSQAHTILDLGEDEFTVGRLHPMLDNDLRLRRLRQEAADPEVGLILLDVVLGEGAHPDPAADLAPAIAKAKAARDLEVVAIVVGTDADPQDVGRQVEALTQAGVTVFRTTTDAVDYISQRLAAPAIESYFSPVPLAVLHHPLAAVNVGLESFYNSLVAQGAAALHVEWRPPAGGNEKLAALLKRLKTKDR